MQIVMAEELRILLVADPVIDQDQPVTVLHEQAAHGPGAEVVGIRRMVLAPQRLGHHAEHGAAIELEETGIDHVQSHGAKFEDP